MPNDHIKSDISAYLSGELPESRKREVEAHVAACDACRQAISKARAKLARHKRQVLKDALPNPIPNLLVKRLDRQAGYNPEPSRKLQIWVGLLLVVVFAAAAVYRHWIPMPSLLALKPNHPSTSETPAAAESPAVNTVVPQAASTETVVAAPAASPMASPDNVEPPRVWSGTDSRIQEFRTPIIRGRTAWNNLWDEMGQSGAAPHVNFYENFVVGVFGGERGGADAKVFLGSPREDSDEVVMTYKVTGTAVSTTTVTGVSHPYLLSTIPRTSKKIRFSPES